MKARTISISDIMGIGRYGKLTVQLPTFKATVNARNQVSYVRRAYPREDGLTYETSTDPKTNTITISVVDKVRRRNKQGNQR